MKTKTLIRIMLSLALIYFVYQETGIFTALSLILIMINTELQALQNKLTNDSLKIIIGDKNEN